MIIVVEIDFGVYLYGGYVNAVYRRQKVRNTPQNRYVDKLRPRKCYQRRPYWHRIRSNPYRMNYH